ncbi:MAG TPA: metal ABC transporter substrate-binding protein [Candidatus Limnocylindrales bacterium]|nr:metal ABC transporter substrate-binding protein [Candidatus Limnocylindrales bacterium]
MSRRLLRLSRAIPLAASALLALGGCAGPAAPSDAPRPLQVVATTTVFADLVRNVGGDLVAVDSLVPKGGDVHTFEPAPSDVTAVASAKLLVMNGLGLDDWLERLVANGAASGTPIVKLGEGVTGVELLPGEDPGTANPHLFMDPVYAERYVDQIVVALQRVDPAHASAYAAQGTAYAARLTTLDAEVRADIATIPEAQRRLVTFHDAFPYYAREYGLMIVGVAVEAPGQEPSAAEIAALIEAIREANVKAIFSEDQFPTRLVDQIAAETGAHVVANLYDDSLGDPPITSYEAVIRWDTDQLVQSLR